MKFKYIIILLAIAGVAVLYLLTLLAQPLFISLSELSLHEGKTVVVEGSVISLYHTRAGNQIITIQDHESTDDSSKAILFVNEMTTVEYGDIIQATGKVQKYKNEWQVVVESSNAIHLIQKWRNITLPLDQISTYHDRYKDVNIRVCGIVDLIDASSFVLSDEKASHFLLVVYNMSNSTHLSVGDRVSVLGAFVYDERFFRYVLSASEIVQNSLPSFQ